MFDSMSEKLNVSNELISNFKNVSSVFRLQEHISLGRKGTNLL